MSKKTKTTTISRDEQVAAEPALPAGTAVAAGEQEATPPITTGAAEAQTAAAGEAPAAISPEPPKPRFLFMGKPYEGGIGKGDAK